MDGKLTAEIGDILFNPDTIDIVGGIIEVYKFLILRSPENKSEYFYFIPCLNIWNNHKNNDATY